MKSQWADYLIDVQQTGDIGPALEQALNRAPDRFGAPHRYTCGHYPQSFEFSTLGGWVVTRAGELVAPEVAVDRLPEGALQLQAERQPLRIEPRRHGQTR